MFSSSTGYYVSPPIDQYLKVKNCCSLLSSACKLVLLMFNQLWDKDWWGTRRKTGTGGTMVQIRLSLPPPKQPPSISSTLGHWPSDQCNTWAWPRIECEFASTLYRLSDAVSILSRAISPSVCKYWKINKWYSILFYSILFYSILFYSILFYSILFYSILFLSI